MAKPFKPERMLQVVRLLAPIARQDSPAYGSSRSESSTVERNL